jgi:orotidine-5'-phosphate decarboxylase
VSQLCLALDVPSIEQAEALVIATAHVFDVYKIGLELFSAHGWRGVERIKASGAPAIFLDLKLHDIPRTVARSISAMAHRDVDYLTVHLAGGTEMLKQSQIAAAEIDLKLLGVSILTSLDTTDMEAIGLGSDLVGNVLNRCRLAYESGIYGVVSSPWEAARIKSEIGARLYCVTPGIRFIDDAVGDQKRIMTPEKAIAKGSDMLVIGRSVTQSTDLSKTLNRLTELKHTL